MKWIKFTDQLPECKWIWIFTGSVVELTRAAYYDKETIRDHRPDWRWIQAELEYPLPPEKEKHICSKASPPYLFEAYETKDSNEMFLKISKKDFLFHLSIDFCPFCGFTLEKNSERENGKDHNNF